VFLHARGILASESQSHSNVIGFNVNCTAHSNEYSSLHRFYNFVGRRAARTRDTIHTCVRRGSPRLAHHRRGEVRPASRMCECPFIIL